MNQKISQLHIFLKIFRNFSDLMYMKQESSLNDFFCLKCDFKCNKKGDWNRHILTQKHKSEYVVKNVKPIIKNKTK